MTNETIEIKKRHAVTKWAETYAHPVSNVTRQLIEWGFAEGAYCARREVARECCKVIAAVLGSRGWSADAIDSICKEVKQKLKE